MSEKITKEQICEIFERLFGFKLDYEKYKQSIDQLISNPNCDVRIIFKPILEDILRMEIDYE